MSSWSEPRVAVVTGGASGIGLAIGERLASDGAAVAISIWTVTPPRLRPARQVAAGPSA